jgi:hypothetical protein
MGSFKDFNRNHLLNFLFWSLYCSLIEVSDFELGVSFNIPIIPFGWAIFTYVFLINLYWRKVLALLSVVCVHSLTSHLNIMFNCLLDFLQHNAWLLGRHWLCMLINMHLFYQTRADRVIHHIRWCYTLWFIFLCCLDLKMSKETSTPWRFCWRLRLLLRAHF